MFRPKANLPFLNKVQAGNVNSQSVHIRKALGNETNTLQTSAHRMLPKLSMSQKTSTKAGQSKLTAFFAGPSRDVQESAIVQGSGEPMRASALKQVPLARVRPHVLQPQHPQKHRFAKSGMQVGNQLSDSVIDDLFGDDDLSDFDCDNSLNVNSSTSAAKHSTAKSLVKNVSSPITAKLPSHQRSTSSLVDLTEEDSRHCTDVGKGRTSNACMEKEEEEEEEEEEILNRSSRRRRITRILKSDDDDTDEDAGCHGDGSSAAWLGRHSQGADGDQFFASDVNEIEDNLIPEPPPSPPIVDDDGMICDLPSSPEPIFPDIYGNDTKPAPPTTVRSNVAVREHAPQNGVVGESRVSSSYVDVRDVAEHPLLFVDILQSPECEVKEHIENLRLLHNTAMEQLCDVICALKPHHVMQLPGLDSKKLMQWINARSQVKKKCDQAEKLLSEPLNTRLNLCASTPKPFTTTFASPAEARRTKTSAVRSRFAPCGNSTLPAGGDSFYEHGVKLARSNSSGGVVVTPPPAAAAGRLSSIGLGHGKLFVNASPECSYGNTLPKDTLGRGQLQMQSPVAHVSNEIYDVINEEIFDEKEYFQQQPFVSSPARISPSTTRVLSIPKPNTSSKEGSLAASQKQPDTGAKFRGNFRDDGSSGHFQGLKFPHSAELLKVFRSVFGLKTFRTNQLQALNAALLGEDTFILMPTGGGKSLCYQLPSLVTQGVTIVVSPLRSLIQDQVQKLCALDVPATHLSGEMTENQSDAIYRQLSMRDPMIKCLYVTPEKLSASTKLLSTLANLYQRHLLSRFVIDEAHCVSNWGHDFRPDYKKLNLLRQKFPGVPMMALTATATPRVRQDILHQLGMKNPKWFMQSFNRPNLQYEVRPKQPKKLSQVIIELIKTEFNRQSGIIYCLSRNECDKMAEELVRAGVKGKAYHAGLSSTERTNVQTQWINENRCQVVCATIAFGMGIDKPDVRYVIHYSLPKSMEGYYQESGRAGRDGLPARCILYYAYSDMHRLRRMVERDADASPEAKRVHIDNLYRIVQYCENLTDCRRAQQLEYFGELFDRKLCKANMVTRCDSCRAEDSYMQRDMTREAQLLVQSVQQVAQGSSQGSWRKKFTLLHFVEVFRGSSAARVEQEGHQRLPAFGAGRHLQRSDAERLVRKLALDDVLGEEITVTAQDMTVAYARVGRRAADLLNGNLKVMFHVKGTKKNAVTAEAAPSTAADKAKAELHNDCYNELVVCARNIALELSMNWKNIYNPDTLKEMSQRLPAAEEEMKEVTGVTDTNYRRYGYRFLEITLQYMAKLTLLDDDFTAGTGDDTFAPNDFASPYFDGPPEHSSVFTGGGRQGRGGGTKRKRRGGGGGFRKAKRQKAATSTEQGNKTKYNKRRGGSANHTPVNGERSGGWLSKQQPGRGAASGRVAAARPGLMPMPATRRPPANARPFLKSLKDFI
ncbi:PREDICTED: Bloom syndrome protein homolog isoform X2 [Priapulus caudatus]|nr:PREDICTED: Bloom syndrome protein homolog isoform X2 [Priapulus caudatus]